MLMENQPGEYDLANAWVFDLESFPSFFSAIFKKGEDIKTYVIYPGVNGVGHQNELIPLLEFLETKPLLVGFNSFSYDNVLLHYLLTYQQALKVTPTEKIVRTLNNLSQAIIGFDDQPREAQDTIKSLRRKDYFPSIDVLEVIREGYNTKSLKGVAVNLKHHRIQDLPHHYLHEVQPEEVGPILEYNENDVVITEKILEEITPRLVMRQVLSEQFGLHLYSDADSKMAKTSLDKMYALAIGKPIQSFQKKRTHRDSLVVKDLIFPWVTFQSPQLQHFLEVFGKQTITNIGESGVLSIPEEYYFKPKAGEAQLQLPFYGMEYTIGLGGIHSVDKPGIFEATEDNLLWDKDVGSQYPSCILNNGVCPEHLDKKVFLDSVRIQVEDRLKNKALGKKGDKQAGLVAEGQKVQINSLYGLFNFQYYWLYDPKCTYEVTLNNQLALLMLIETLNMAGIQVISANTDGIILQTSPRNKDLVNGICQEWEQTTGFVLEDTFYSKYIRRDINNFAAIKTDGEVKVKGIFIPQGGILKGYDKPIVAIALRNYFVDGIPVEQTIRNIGTPYIFSNLLVKGDPRVTDIYDYCSAQKVGSQYYQVEWEENGVVTPIQKSVRYYASNSGGSIYKLKKGKDGEVSRGSLFAQSLVTLFNDFQEGPYDLNFQFYIDETEKIVAQIEGREWIDKSKVKEKVEKLKERETKSLTLYMGYHEKGKTHLKMAQSTRENLIKIWEELHTLTPYLT